MDDKDDPGRTCIYDIDDTNWWKFPTTDDNSLCEGKFG